ncbi:MAG: tetratricopeptide repeat-containing sensor histidine kinase [Bacteroidetes bacterium]|nr:tetratricopeptide repeat-containing sensor histidine kinase [Bacteroidota bacterium]
MRAVVFTLIFVCFTKVALSAPDIKHYLSQLRQAVTEIEVKRIIADIEDKARKDKKFIADEDYATFIEIVQSKPFAKKILPGVYRWIGLRYASERMGAAVQYFLESATLFAQQHKNLEQALCYLEVALFQHNVNNLNEAKEYYVKALALAKDSLDYRTIIICYNGTGLVHRESKQYDSARMDFSTGLAMAQAKSDLAWVGILEGNIGSILLLQKEYDSSLYYYQKNLADIKKTNEIENEVETYERIARTLIYKKKPNLALSYLDSCLQVIKEKKISPHEFFNPYDKIYESYAMAYEQVGNRDKAYEYFKKFHEVNEGKNIFQKAQGLLQLQSDYNFKQKQSEIDLLRKINETDAKVIVQQGYIQLAFIVIIALLAMVVLVLVYTGKQKKRVNDQLNKANEELDRLNQTKDKLISVVSHDLRSPLQNLSGMMTLINDGHITQHQFDEHLRKINQQMNATINALDSLLKWANAQLSNVKIHPELLLVRKKSELVVNELYNQALKKGITLTNKIPEDLMVVADGSQLEIILRNLVSNAIKFTKQHGTVAIQGIQREGRVEIRVEDNGVGIEAEYKNQLFKPGKKFSLPGTHQEKGTGIGLTITKEMVLANGGDIHVESEIGKGSSFIFTLAAPLST